MDAYLRNAWYVAAWSGEIVDKPLGRKLLDEPVLFYRRTDGTVTALQDRCPHRFVPLSRGRVEGDNIRCGYHGLRFNAEGSCIDDRCNDLLRAAAKLRRYPVEERYGAIWIWMGTDAANPSLIPDCSFLVDPARTILFDQTLVKANYMLEIDNLLDLSHLDYVHLGTISNGSFSEGVFKTWHDDAGIHSTWWTEDCSIPPQFVPYLVGAERVDQWADVTWRAPGNVYIHSGGTRCKQPKEAGYWIEQCHSLTPETALTTHYFWGIARPNLGEPPEVNEFAKGRLRQAFVTEDATMIEAQQSAMKSTDFWAEKPIVLPEDGAAIRARHSMAKLIRAEQQRSATTTKVATAGAAS
jgi:phenylpropionate dioxygenase-like ring-hydroxylating dioxygenase large terminal subunit